MNVQVLGTGCARCKALETKVREVAAANKINADIEKVTDIREIMKYGILATPGLVINDEVKSSGVIPDNDQILKWLEGK
jgi:small redox-active disulfide protein 2